MIIEPAFFKLPELLLGHSFPSEQYEPTITTYVSLGILSELNSRNVDNPAARISAERPYPLASGFKIARVDLHVDLSGLYSRGLWHSLYGMKPSNWVEVKYFGGIGRSRGEETKTENAAYIMLDILRLCLFVREETSPQRENGRYLLCVFNRKPETYVAFRRRGGHGDRDYLISLLTPGMHRGVGFSLDEEPPSFGRVLGVSPRLGATNLTLVMDAVTVGFEPYELKSDYLYWGYLIRIMNYEVMLGELKLTYSDTSEDMWTKEQQQVQDDLCRRLLESDGIGGPN